MLLCNLGDLIRIWNMNTSSLYWTPLDELKELQRFSLHLRLSLRNPFCLLFFCQPVLPFIVSYQWPYMPDKNSVLIHNRACCLFCNDHGRITVVDIPETQTHFWVILKGWLGFSASSLNIGSESSQAPDVGLLKSVLQYGTKHTGVCGGRITASSPIIYCY